MFEKLCTEDYVSIGFVFISIIICIGLSISLIWQFIQFLKQSDKVEKIIKNIVRFILAVLVVVVGVYAIYWIVYGIGWIISLILCGK